MNQEIVEKIESMGFSNVKIFKDFSYDTALIGVTTSGRAVYSYSKMVEWLMKEQDFSEEEAEDWISFNTIGAISDAPGEPLIMMDLEE